MTDLHSMLVHLREHGPRASHLGICSQLNHSNMPALRAMFPEWPEYSGNLACPVPHPHKAPDAAYMQTAALWSRHTEYGKARWRLLDFLIEKTRPEMIKFNDGGWAFPGGPVLNEYGSKIGTAPGMSLRDYAAIKCAAAMVSGTTSEGIRARPGDAELTAKAAYTLADALIAESKKEPNHE